MLSPMAGPQRVCRQLHLHAVGDGELRALGPAHPLLVVGARGGAVRPPVGGREIVHAGRPALRERDVVSEADGMNADLVAALPPGRGCRCVGIRQPARRVEGHRAAERLDLVDQPVERALVVHVRVTGDDHQRAGAGGEVPEARHRQIVGEQVDDRPGEQPGLHVHVGHRHALAVDRLVERLHRAVRQRAVALDAAQRRISLAAIGHAAGQVERPGGGAARSHHRRVRRGRGERAVEGGERTGPGDRCVVVGDTGKGQGDGGQAGAGRLRLVDGQVPVGLAGAGRDDAERRRQLRVGLHRHQPAATADMLDEQLRLPRRERHLGEHDQPGRGEQAGVDAVDVSRGDGVQALDLEHFFEVPAERVRRACAHHQEDRWRAGLHRHPGAAENERQGQGQKKGDAGLGGKH